MPHAPLTPHLILGGSRSGKSVYAEQLLTAFSPPYVFLATAQVLDDEFRERVRIHQARRNTLWETLETPHDLLQTLRSLQGRGRPVLLDCLTLWLSNVLLQEDPPVPETAVDELCRVLVAVDFPLYIVSNEVGSGIVPENPLARRFRDLSGYANQQAAKVCRAVTLVVAGLPLRLK